VKKLLALFVAACFLVSLTGCPATPTTRTGGTRPTTSGPKAGDLTKTDKDTKPSDTKDTKPSDTKDTKPSDTKDTKPSDTKKG
jgi:hypothetical protein